MENCPNLYILSGSMQNPIQKAALPLQRHLPESQITSHEISELTQTEHVPFKADPRIPQLTQVRISDKRLKKHKNGGLSFSDARHLHESRTTTHESRPRQMTKIVGQDSFAPIYTFAAKRRTFPTAPIIPEIPDNPDSKVLSFACYHLLKILNYLSNPTPSPCNFRILCYTMDNNEHLVQ